MSKFLIDCGHTLSGGYIFKHIEQLESGIYEGIL